MILIFSNISLFFFLFLSFFLFRPESWGWTGWLWWHTITHGSYWRTSLCLISLLQWAHGCWAQRVAICLPPQIALKSPCGVLQFLWNCPFVLRSSSLCQQFSDGASARIWAETYCNMLCCSLHIKQSIPPPSLFCTVFIRESERLGCRSRDEVNAVLLLNRRFKCLALLEVSDPVYSIIVKGKWKNKLNLALKKTWVRETMITRVTEHTLSTSPNTMPLTGVVFLAVNGYYCLWFHCWMMYLKRKWSHTLYGSTWHCSATILIPFAFNYESTGSLWFKIL